MVSLSGRHTAFLYPGQGSQRVGMGTELLKHAPALFERYVAAADEVAERPISRLCLDGMIEELTETRVAQPALFVVSLALTEHARTVGLEPLLVAGHSLGEYTAAVAAGVLSFEEGLRLVCARADLMARAQGTRPGAMAMIAGLTSEHVAALCASVSTGYVSPANLNAPTQTVIAGDAPAVQQVVELATAAGASEAFQLRVEVAGHSPLMQAVADGLAPLFDTVRWQEPAIPLVANTTGAVLTTARAVRESLLSQIVQPVQWVACVQRMQAFGCTYFLELGSGRVLSGLVKQILPEADTYASASPRRISAVAAESGVA